VVGNTAKGERAMSQAAGGGSRAEIERALVQRSIEEEDFRQRLLADPKGTLEQALETQLAEDVEVRVVEENPQTIYLVLPGTSSPLGEEELSDRALEAVAGGVSTWSDETCGCPT
jgi:hypothetical protein